MKPLAEEWLSKADEDFRVAERELAAEPPAFAAVCFHAQQAVEKAMKALLVDFGVDFPRTHDLKFLLDLIKNNTPIFNDLEEALVNLSVSAVEVRYPGSKPDRHLAEKAVDVMRDFFSVFSESFPRG
ncbi:MAG TPA: HEPN domain-containing protein [bacterium]|nr:HEPN domain-containing protein [bacterium]